MKNLKGRFLRWLLVTAMICAVIVAQGQTIVGSFSFYPTNQGGTILGKAQVSGVAATAGDIIAAFDPAGECVGAAPLVINSGIAYINMVIYGDDGGGHGMSSGELFYLKLYDASAGTIIDYGTGLSGWQNTNFAPMAGYNNVSAVYNFVTLSFTVSLNIDNAITCAGGSSGAISAIVSGGLPPYSYIWSNGATTAVNGGLIAGLYFITVIDANNSTLIDSVEISQPDSISIFGIVNQVSITGGNDGAINLIVSGGFLPYTYLWNTSATIQNIQNLFEGAYYVTVTDANGCLKTDSFTVSVSLPYTLNFDGIDESGSIVGDLYLPDSTFTIEAWIKPDYLNNLHEIVCWYDSINNVQFRIFYNYSLLYGETQGSTWEYIVTDPGVVTDQWTHVAITKENGLCTIYVNGGIVGSGMINNNVKPANMYIGSRLFYNDRFFPGKIDDIRIWNVARNSTQIQANMCMGSVISDPTLLNRWQFNEGPGFAYSVDEINNRIAILNNMEYLPGYDCDWIMHSCTSIDVIPTDISCFGESDGSIDLNLSGDSSSYSIYWSNGMSTEDLAYLSAGSYYATITDTYGESYYISTYINEPQQIEINAYIYNLNSIGANDGAIELTISGGNPPYSYLWSNGLTNKDIYNLSSGFYFVTITDNNGCVANDSAQIFLSDPMCLSFDGFDDHVIIPASSLLSLADSITLSMWFNPEKLTNIQPGTNPNGYSYLFDDSNIRIYLNETHYSSYNNHSLLIRLIMANGQTVTINTPPYSIAKNLWQNFTFTYSDSNPRVYINGIEMQLTFLDNILPVGDIQNSSYNPLYIGNRNDLIRPFAGQIDETKIWNKVLSQMEIQTELCGLSNFNQIAAYWPFDDGNNSINLVDYSGSFNHGSLINYNFMDSLSGWLPKMCGQIETNDIGIVAFANPQPVYANLLFDTLQSVEIVIKNLGTDSISESGIVYYKMNGGIPIVETVNINLAPSGYFVHSFSQYLDLSTPGTYSIEAAITISSDLNAQNDTLIQIVDVNEINRPAFAFTSSDRFVLFDLDDPGDEYPFGPTLTNDYFQGGTWIYNSWYAITSNSGLLVRINLYDANIDTIGYTGIINIGGMSFDYSTNTLYAITYNGDIYSININTGASVFLNNTDLWYTGWINLAAKDGVLYTVDVNYDELWSWIPGQYLQGNYIGYVGFDTYYAQDMEFDYNTGELLMAAYNNGVGGELRLVDTSDGSTTLLGGFYQGHEYMGFAIPFNPDTLSADFVYDYSSPNDSLILQFTDISEGYPSSWTWDFGDGNYSTQENPIHTYLSNGIYEIKLIVSNFFGSDTITKPLVLPLENFYIDAQPSNLLCYSDFSGNINLNITGNYFPYSFTWSNGANTQNISGLEAGLYIVTVTDANNTSLIDTIFITEPDPIVVSSYIINTSASGTSDGNVRLNVTGGTSPYTYLWSNGETNWYNNSLAAGAYYVTVEDSNGCYAFNNYEVIVNDIPGSICNAPTITDYDQNTYNTIQIGNQCWMKENLKSVHFADGSSIVDGTNAGSISGDFLTKYYFNYDNNPANSLVYGKLYNWAAAVNGADGSIYNQTGVQGACPAGWHLPSQQEWWNLVNYLVYDTLAGGKLKETGFSHWNSPNLYATNSSGFTALPGGRRSPTGGFSQKGDRGIFWSCSQTSNPSMAWDLSLYYEEGWAGVGSNADKNFGFSIRCVKDADTVNSSFPNWSYNITGVNHTILVTDTIPLVIDNIPVEAGDVLGVFYDSLGIEKCGGYVVWQGSTIALAAWGEQSGNDGFTSGEEFKWKIWDSSEGISYNAQATYFQNYPQTAYFAANGISVLSSLIYQSSDTQFVSIPLGWGIFSTYIDPFEPSIDSMFSNIVSQIYIVKNSYGTVYWPAFNLNMIGNHTIGQGYQVRAVSAQILEVVGEKVIPENTPFNIPQGWSLIGYLRTTPADPVVLFSQVISNIVLIKNEYGAVYWPAFGLNMIGNMQPGKGYQINANSAFTFAYPANTANIAKSDFVIEKPVIFHNNLNTGANMTLGIIHDQSTLSPGDEIGVFSRSGLLVGAAVVDGDFTSVAVWGDDELTPEIDGLMEGEEFVIKIYNVQADLANMATLNWIEGDGIYSKDKIAIADFSGKLEYEKTVLYQNSPNPFTLETEFSFYLPEKTKVNFSIINLIGEKVETLVCEEMEKGKHILKYQTNSIPAGSYYYRLETVDYSKTMKMVIVK